MHDFCEAYASKMFYSEIAKEEGRAEAKAERNIDVAEDLLRDGSLPLERIGAISHLSLEHVRELPIKSP